MNDPGREDGQRSSPKNANQMMQSIRLASGRRLLKSTTLPA
jgi:hypothetical protein